MSDRCFADGEYDAIIMGTGLTECMISGLLATNGKKVLHVDRNNYYGADTASLSLTNLYQKFRNSEAPANLGHSRDWNVDLVPKFIMACGSLVKILLHSKVTRYLEFKSVDGSYVFKDGKPQKVPATASEALNSSLMGFFEKRKFRNFLVFLQSYDKKNASTWRNGKRMRFVCPFVIVREGKPLEQWTMRQLFNDFGLDEYTCVRNCLQLYCLVMNARLSLGMLWHWKLLMSISTVQLPKLARPFNSTPTLWKDMENLPIFILFMVLVAFLKDFQDCALSMAVPLC